MGNPLILSLFPGIGMLDAAFEQEGFCIVRGPDVLWGGDIRRFHPPAGRFDGVIGGPPCQCFSQLAYMVRHRGHQSRFGNLIPEFERCILEAQPQWFLMENVPKAPLPMVFGYSTWSTLLNNRQLGQTANRLRRWSFGRCDGGNTILMIETVALEPILFERAAISYQVNNDRDIKLSDPKRRMKHFGYRGTPTFRAVCRKQGLTENFDVPGFTVEAKIQAVVNGVPMAMGRALARAVKEAVSADARGMV